MGVRGLQSFLEQSCRSSIPIQTIHHLAESQRNSPGEELVIVVDGSNCIRHIYADLAWVGGAQLKEYGAKAEEFVNEFRAIGIRLVFFFDGPTVQKKRRTWVERRMNTMNKVNHVLDKISNGTPSNSINKNDYFMLPPAMGQQTRLIFEIICGCEAKRANLTTVLSGTITGDNDVWDAVMVNIREVHILANLRSVVQEADSRIILRLFNAVERGLTSVIVLSNDKDVVVLILFYIFELYEKCFKELWIKIGVGERKRYLPIHLLGASLGSALFNSIMKAHVLTVCDVTSKIGTKIGALKAMPEKFLHKFAQEDTIKEKDLDSAS